MFTRLGVSVGKTAFPWDGQFGKPNLETLPWKHGELGIAHRENWKVDQHNTIYGEWTNKEWNIMGRYGEIVINHLMLGVNIRHHCNPTANMLISISNDGELSSKNVRWTKTKESWIFHPHFGVEKWYCHGQPPPYVFGYIFPAHFNVDPLVTASYTVISRLFLSCCPSFYQ